MTRPAASSSAARSWLARLLIWLVLVSVHTASFAQVVRPIIWGPHGAPHTGFAANGTFLQNGIITPNPHQGLHTLMNVSVWTMSAFAMSNPADPNFVQPSLADMATALNLTPQQAVAQINTLYVGPNPYANVNPPNANTASNMAAYDQILADFAALGGLAGTTEPQGSLSIFGPNALMNTPVFQAALPDGRGAAGVIISESIESVQNSAAVANFNAIQIQNTALLGSPIYYSRHRMNLGDPGGNGNANCIALGECSAGGSAQQIHQNLFGPQSLQSGIELGYYLPGGTAHSFELGKNPHFATSLMGAGGGETGNLDPRSNAILAQNLAKATSQHIKGQQVAAGIDFSLFEEDRALFMQGVDLYAHVSTPAERALLDALKSGSLKPGDAGYEAAQALAQRSFSRAWAQHVEYETSIVHNRESAHYQAQRLQLQGTGDQELFRQGLNLYCKSCDPEQEEGLRKLAQGQLKEGDAGYQQARDLAEQRFKLAYENSLLPPPKKSWFKQLAAVVVAAVAAFFIGPAVSGWLSGVIPGATATSAAGATVIAGTAGTPLTIGGALASGIGSAVASTTSAFLSTSIATGSASQGLKAAGRALKGGLVTAAVGMVAPALGFTNTESLANRSFSVVAQATGATVAGGGSFGQNLLNAGISAGMQYAGAEVAGSIGDQHPSGTAFNYAGHAAWGCISGAVAARSGSGCGSGAAGAVVGDWAGQQVHENLKGANPNGLLQGFANATGSIDGTAAFFAGMVGGATAAAVGKPDKVQQNFGIGQSGAENAFVHNHLAHPDRINDPAVREKIAAAGRECKGPASCEAMVAGLDAQIDLLSDENIASMCGNRPSCVANRTLEREAYVDARDSAIGRLDPEAAAVSYINSQTNAPYSRGEIAGAVTRIQQGSADPANPIDAYVRDSLGRKPAMLAAVLGVSIIDGDAGGTRGAGGGPKRPGSAQPSTGEVTATSNLRPSGAVPPATQVELAPPANTYSVYARGEGAAKGPLPPGYSTVSRWVSPEEASLWLQNQGTAIPAAIPRNGTPQLYVTQAGAPYPPGANGTVRIDFAVPNTMLRPGNAPNNYMILQPSSSTPIYNVNIHVPNGVTLPKPR